MTVPALTLERREAVRRMKVLVYGAIDMNLIDGSSVWLGSLVDVLLASQCVSHVTILRHTPLYAPRMPGEPSVRWSSVTWFDPWSMSDLLLRRGGVEKPGGNRLSPDKAAEIILALDQQEEYDVIILRAPAVLRSLARRPLVLGKIWAYLTDPLHLQESDAAFLRMYHEALGRLVCQGEEAKQVFMKCLGVVDPEMFVLLPPMIPEVSSHVPPAPIRCPPRLGYAGKLSPGYMILEMIEAFGLIRKELPDAELHIVGDKFHNVPFIPGFEAKVRAALGEDSRIFWYGGRTRNETLSIMSRVHVAASWRDAGADRLRAHRRQDHGHHLVSPVARRGAESGTALRNH